MHDGPSPPSGTARAIVGGGESLIVAELGNGRADRVPELLPDILYFALTPYVGQEVGARARARLSQRLSTTDLTQIGHLGRRPAGACLDTLRYHK